MELDRLSWVRVSMLVLSAVKYANSTSEQATAVVVRAVWYKRQCSCVVVVKLCILKIQ